ncbi:hypothetical protein M9H77_18951 [Catharanthus roseus]|uniref:Uncharacterized protein n=1 Tax=Catharanthus roseus TaxID=4058 RepID=A0ACC0B967_CATRO|nr:hypothetical protein M9H77_18951 [Catharanthus roseus]
MIDRKGKDGGWMRGKGKGKDSETNGARDAPWTEIVTKPTQRMNTYDFRSSLTECSSEGQPAHTASEEDSTTGTRCGRPCQGSIEGGKGTRMVEESGEARSFDENGRNE